jgi:small neutral amino acid transporter SnatA (MarC family)
MGPVEFALLATTSIIAVMNLTSTVAIYIALTRDMNLEESRKIIAKSENIVCCFGVPCFYRIASLLNL